MLDNTLFALIISLLQSGLTSIGQGSILIQQNYQPTQEGTPTAPTLFLYKISDERMGWPARQSIQSAGSSSFTGSISGSVLTVSAVASGTIAVNQQIQGTSLPTNLVITGLLTGSGGTGTYQLNYAPGTFASQSMTSNGAQVYTETEQYITTFQMSALATQDPTNTESLTASDILNLAASVIQSAATITGLENEGMGILAISQVQNPYFSDDRVRYEASPSLDFKITHKQIVTTVVPVIISEELQVLYV